MSRRFIIILIVMPFFVFCQSKKPIDMVIKEINNNWTFKEINGTHTGNASVPGTIHTDLLANGFIEDPFYRVNEKKQQWIDKKDWEYTTNLEITAEEFKKNNIFLIFEGLDTYADVFLNDTLILESNNMFRSWEINVKPFISLGKNSLRVLFHSPIKKGLELLATAPFPYPAINDQSETGEIGDKKVSVFTRKAGYHYGWDWGPRFVTSGIWRPVVLKTWNSISIKNVFIKQPKVSAEIAEVIVDVNFQVNKNINGYVLITNNETGEEYIREKVDIAKDAKILSFPITIKNPKLWWSNGLGKPNMYHFTVRFLDENKSEIAATEIETGLRSLKLIREKDAVGESFLFELNGVRVFVKGANYIPNDSFLPRVSQADYEKVVSDAVNANMNMLRVWGGGIYENDEFYKLCDENGLLIWQDFMFACSMYPGDKAFLDNVKQEAIDNVTRLRNHPSIALWCGNNEINTAWSHYSKGGWGWKEKYTQEQREEIQKAYLDIFHDILPNVIKNYTDGDDYWPSSPQAGFEPQKHAGYENTSGDMHYWGVWHGQHPFEDFEKYKARFMSEYGFQSFPDFETVKKYTLPSDYNIESEVMTSHQRSGIGNLRIKEYMELDYKVPSNFEYFLYMSQILQARGVKMAIEAHRRAMPYCMGTMYWQINDCWPVASWSSTDFYHKWKALHYAVKKAYEPILLTINEEKNSLKIYGISDLLEDKKGILKLTVIDFNGKQISKIIEKVILKQNTSTNLYSIDKDLLLGNANAQNSVLNVEYLNDESKVISSNLYYFVKPKDLQLMVPEIKTKIVKNKGKNYLLVSSDKLVKDLYLNFKNQEVFLSDNYFDLLPNQLKKIELSGSSFDINNLELKHL